MKRWILTPNNQILDIENIKNICIENLKNSHNIIFKDYDNIQWLIAEFGDEKSAIDYLNKIYYEMSYFNENPTT